LKELLQKDCKIVDDPPPVGKDFNDFLLSYLEIATKRVSQYVLKDEKEFVEQLHSMNCSVKRIIQMIKKSC